MSFFQTRCDRRRAPNGRRGTLAVLFIAFAFVCGGCSHSERRPSVLQRYDGLKSELSWETAESSRISLDVATLRSAIQRGRVNEARQSAVRLKRDGRLFMVRSGHFGNAVRLLAQSAHPGIVQRYLYAVVAALTADWYEGTLLSSMSDVVWADPLGLVPATSQRLSRMTARARSFAATAVADAREAQMLRQRDRRLFRYTFVDNSRGTH